MIRYYEGRLIAENNEKYNIRVKPENLHEQCVTEIDIELLVGLPAHNRSEWQKRTSTSVFPPKPKEMYLEIDGDVLQICFLTERQQKQLNMS